MATRAPETALFRGLSVPVAAAQLAAPDADLTGLLVAVGCRAEADLEAVAATLGPEVASRMAGFWAATRRATVRNELEVVTRRVLVEDRQDTGRAKRDLDDALAALDSHPALAAVTAVLLAPTCPDSAAFDSLKRAGCAVVVSETGAAVTVSAAAPGWPAALGGAPLPNEGRRWFCLEARYASWRDRRVRRLAKLTVWAEESWPVLPRV